MEGPSLFIAQEQLRPFKNKVVLEVSGNTTIEKERFLNEKVCDIFTWGKHLVFQFDGFALKVHFLLYGTYSAEVEGVSATGDYKKARVPRLAFTFENGKIEMYNSSVKIIEDPDFKSSYDFSADIMSPEWDGIKAYKKVKKFPQEEIADILLDQDIFGGVGNIIKNEVFSLTFTHPQTKVEDLTPKKLEEIIEKAQQFSLQFYKWRRRFVLKKNLKIHRRSTCPHCSGKVTNKKTGKRNRWSHFCPHCQAMPE